LPENSFNIFKLNYDKRYKPFPDQIAVKELIILLNKVLKYFDKYIIQNINFSKQAKFIKSKFTTRQKRIIKRVLFLNGKPKSDQVSLIAKKLYNLGFSDHPLEELAVLAGGNSSIHLRRAAAWELAKWHFSKGDEEGARLCHEYLSIANEGEDDATIRCYNTIMEAECHEKLNNFTAGKNIIYAALDSYGPEPNLYLAAANFESTLEGRVVLINKALECYGLSPVTFNDSNAKPFIDRLYSKPVANKVWEKTYERIPLISVIVAVYNAQKSLGSALESLMAQTWTNLELLVVDDCSSDASVSIVEEYNRIDNRIKLIKAQENRGLFYSRNLALQEAEGEYVTTHDADDWAHPEKIECQVRHLIREPSIVANTSQMALTQPDLKFYQGQRGENIIGTFPCSFMFRRKPVMNKVGYWDQVRFSADREYIRRVQKVFGKKAVTNFLTGPLTFYRRAEYSLTGNHSFGYPGYYMGARKEYYESQTHYHQKEKNLYFHFPQKDRPFPVPEPMWIKREPVGAKGRRQFDLLIGSDFRVSDGSLNPVLETLQEYRERGVRIGLIQLYCYHYDPDSMIMAQVREVIDGNMIQVVVYGEKISSDLLIIYNPEVLQEKQRYLPDVKADDLKVVVNKTPFAHNMFTSRVRFEIKKCESRLNEYFGQVGVWYPFNAKLRKKLVRHHAKELESINLSENDWIDVSDKLNSNGITDLRIKGTGRK